MVYRGSEHYQGKTLGALSSSGFGLSFPGIRMSASCSLLLSRGSHPVFSASVSRVLSGRFLTVGGAKTEGGEGRIIPLNDLYEAFVQHRAMCIEAGSGSRRNLLRRNLLRRQYILIQTEAEPKRKWGISAMTRHAKPRRRIGFV